MWRGVILHSICEFYYVNGACTAITTCITKRFVPLILVHFLRAQLHIYAVSSVIFFVIDAIGLCFIDNAFWF